MISILMPTFNRQKFIKDSIQAIIDQDYQDWELIIQNGGDKVEIQDDKRIKLFNEKDNGITDAMNRAMRRATGDIFVWANDDDKIAEGTLQFISQNLIAEWAYGKILLTSGTTMGGGYNYEELKRNNFIPQPSVYWTRKAYETVGEMDEENDLVSDYEYWLRLGSKFDPQYFDRIMAYYTIHPDQITSKIPQQQTTQANNVRKKYEMFIR
jgi:glycosyltransferase involved in cell wall biosynthesis